MSPTVTATRNCWRTQKPGSRPATRAASGGLRAILLADFPDATKDQAGLLEVRSVWWLWRAYVGRHGRGFSAERTTRRSGHRIRWWDNGVQYPFPPRFTYAVVHQFPGRATVTGCTRGGRSYYKMRTACRSRKHPYWRPVPWDEIGWITRLSDWLTLALTFWFPVWHAWPLWEGQSLLMDQKVFGRDGMPSDVWFWPMWLWSQ